VTATESGWVYDGQVGAAAAGFNASVIKQPDDAMREAVSNQHVTGMV